MKAAKLRHAGPGGIAPARRGPLTVEAVVLLAASLTWLASYNREALTQREQVYKASDTGKAFWSYQFDDRSEGGTSTATAVDGEQLSWTCDVRKTYEYGFCGYGVIFDLHQTGRGVDLRGFDSVSFTLRYEGSGKSQRLAILNKNPLYAKLGAPNEDKVNQASFSISPGLHKVSISLDQFAVAEWWRDRAARPSVELARPSFENVTAIEIMTGPDSEAGRQSLSIERIAFNDRAMSAEKWYAGVALAWLLLIGAILVLRRREADKWRKQLIESMKTTVDTIPHMVWSLDARGKATFNKRWEDFTGVALGNGGWRELRRLIHPDDARETVKQWREGLRRGSEFEIELRLFHKLGGHRWVMFHAVPSFAADGAIIGWYGTCTDIHDRMVAQRALNSSIRKERRRSKQLKWSSEHDPLTRLPNRRAFETRLDEAILEAEASGAQIGLLLVDMDYFKHTNDTMGHAAGDELLKEIAIRLRHAVRKHDLVARIGGDEFAVILPNVQSEAAVAAVGHGVAATIQHALNIGDHVVRPSASIGGTLCPRGVTQASDFLKRADAALYALKRSGRGGFRLFESYMLDDVKQVAFQLARAREAIVDGSIIAVYQPKVSIGGGAIVGFEALLRFRTPDGALGLPDMLAEAFNDYELAAKIGEAMQERVVRDIRGWIDAGIAFGRISINASPAEFLRNDYAERLLAVLDRNGVPPSCVEVEVTEHAFVELGRDYVARALDRLKRVGVTISLDDFGTGHSSLSHIRDFPVDLIKIDRSYTRLIIDDGAIASLVTGLVHLACNLGLKVVAEGVETDRQLELLRVMGCHFAQGHLMGLPLECEMVGAFVADHAIPAPELSASSRAA